MPKVDKFNPGGLFKNLLSLLLKFGPLIFAEGQPGTVKSAGPVTPDSVKADVEAVALATEGYEPGQVGGPMVDALIEKALRSLLALAESNVDRAAELLSDLVDRLPFPLP